MNFLKNIKNAIGSDSLKKTISELKTNSENQLKKAKDFVNFEKIQSHVDFLKKKTSGFKKLEQVSTEQKETTLNDEHNSWLLKEVSKAYDSYLSGKSEFISHSDAMKCLDKTKHDVWLSKEVRKAYDSYGAGRSEFVSHSDSIKNLDIKMNEITLINKLVVDKIKANVKEFCEPTNKHKKTKDK